MGKMKEIFMEENYFFGEIDMEREFLVNDLLAQEYEYEEYEKLKSNKKSTTKIEINANQPTTKIEISSEESSPYKKTKETEPGF